MGDAERREGGELDHRPRRPLEQDRQDDDVEGRGLTESRIDPHVVAGNLGEQDPLLLLGALADQSFTETEGGRQMLPFFVAVTGLELQDGVATVGRAGH